MGSTIFVREEGRKDHLANTFSSHTRRLLHTLSTSYTPYLILVHNNILIITQPQFFSHSNGNSPSVAMAHRGLLKEVFVGISILLFAKKAPKIISPTHTGFIIDAADEIAVAQNVTVQPNLVTPPDTGLLPLLFAFLVLEFSDPNRLSEPVIQVFPRTSRNARTWPHMNVTNILKSFVPSKPKDSSKVLSYPRSEIHGYLALSFKQVSLQLTFSMSSLLTRSRLCFRQHPQQCRSPLLRGLHRVWSVESWQMDLKNICPERLPKATVRRDGPVFNHVFPQQENGSEASEKCSPTLQHHRADFPECDEYRGWEILQTSTIELKTKSGKEAMKTEQRAFLLRQNGSKFSNVT